MSLQKKKIIAVIDDDRGTRCALIRLLAALGYDAESFDSAEAFLDVAPTSRAGCLLVDIQLGDISGIELARHLATDGFKVPIIFMSGLNDEQVRRQAEAAGVAFLNKPFSAALLTEAIAKATDWRIESPPSGPGA